MSFPKKIHFCWLSKDPYPPKIARCMASWRKVMPDHEIVLWDTERFPMAQANTYVREAYEQGRYAFAADYIRLYALYTEGGIYLDSDVLLLKPLDELLTHNFVTALEYHPTQAERDGAFYRIDSEGRRTAKGYISGIQLQAAVMAARPGCDFVKEAMDWYEDQHFVRPDGTLATDVLSPQIYAQIAEKRGFRYKDEDQLLEGDVMIHRSEIFAGNKHEATAQSYAIHYCAHSWAMNWRKRLRRWLGV